MGTGIKPTPRETSDEYSAYSFNQPTCNIVVLVVTESEIFEGTPQGATQHVGRQSARLLEWPRTLFGGKYSLHGSVQGARNESVLEIERALGSTASTIL